MHSQSKFPSKFSERTLRNHQITGIIYTSFVADLMLAFQMLTYGNLLKRIS